MSNTELSRGLRLDQKVIELIPQLSRAFAARLIDEGKVLVNGTVNDKPGYKLRATDEVTVNYDLAELDRIPTIDVPILYEDANVVVIDKPTGLLTHSKGTFNPEPTVATWLRSRLVPGMVGQRAGIVHRLDRATSGVLIAAKNPMALSWLQKQFSQRKVQKTYYAIVGGRLPHNHAIIDMPIARNPNKPQTFYPTATGKTAITEYWVQNENKGLSLLELRPQTGRTHQLRVHLSAIGHPILGDPLYGNKAADRMYLHAEKLELTLPSRERKIFISSIPDSFKEQLAL